jgi:hypothetical protein
LCPNVPALALAPIIAIERARNIAATDPSVDAQPISFADVLLETAIAPRESSVESLFFGYAIELDTLRARLD